MSQATVTIQTSRELVAFSQALIAARHEFEDSQAASLEEIGRQIAEGAKLNTTRALVAEDMHRAKRSVADWLDERFTLQERRKLSGDPVRHSAFAALEA